MMCFVDVLVELWTVKKSANETCSCIHVWRLTTLYAVYYRHPWMSSIQEEVLYTFLILCMYPHFRDVLIDRYFPPYVYIMVLPKFNYLISGSIILSL
jgi:hypothetical protein